MLNFPLSHGSHWASSTFRHQQGRWFFPDLQLLLSFLDGGSLAQPWSQVVSGSTTTQICGFPEGGSSSSPGCLPRWFPGWERREARGSESISFSDTEPFSWHLLLITSVQKEGCRMRTLMLREGTCLVSKGAKIEPQALWLTALLSAQWGGKMSRLCLACLLLNILLLLLLLPKCVWTHYQKFWFHD